MKSRKESQVNAQIAGMGYWLYDESINQAGKSRRRSWASVSKAARQGKFTAWVIVEGESSSPWSSWSSYLRAASLAPLSTLSGFGLSHSEVTSCLFYRYSVVLIVSDTEPRQERDAYFLCRWTVNKLLEVPVWRNA